LPEIDLFTRSFLILFVLLNPFILSIYLLEVVTELQFRQFARQLTQALIISFAVFVAFAWAGDRLFEDAFQVRFFAFRIFGGITFLIVGIRLIMGTEAVKRRSHDEQTAAAIAMPFIVGPGTISAAVVAGARLDRVAATAAIALALVAALAAMLLFKHVHDLLQARHERLLDRYTEIAGRATALFAGSFAIDMILRGVEDWLAFLEATA
jgi:multiple antibiotic resistance protein